MKNKLLILIVSSILMAPGLSSANGLRCAGFVIVTTNAAGTTYIHGTPNVRWNGLATPVSEYIYVAGTEATGIVTIRARNDDGTTGFCTIPWTSPYYNDAVHLRRQNGDGTRIYAYKTRGSNECRYLYTENHSCRLH